MVEIGQPAPDFTLPRDGGGEVTLSALQGSPVVVYFYPKDDTSGCTKEAIAFTEMMPKFEALQTVVLGISRNSIKDHDKFKQKHGLAVTLLSDEGGDATEAYGVWVEKSMYGKKYMGIERTTVLVAPDGTVAKLWPKVKVPGHVDAVLAAVEDL